MLTTPSRQQGLQTRLYASNLSASATPATVRQHFGTAGVVVKVELTAQGAGRAPLSAYVTMATPADADAAIRKLHGRLFHDRSMMVSLAPPSSESQVEEPKQVEPHSPRVAVSQQYRERLGMVFELDCGGVPLTLRFSFPDDAGGERHAEVRVVSSSEELVVAGSGQTREAALAAAAEAWQRLETTPPAPALAWDEINTVLRTVRAI